VRFPRATRLKSYEQAHPVEEEPLTISERARLRELERENRELRLEREFLSKAAAFCVSRARGALPSDR
jgi:transposase